MIKKAGKLNGEDVLEATLQSGRHKISILNYGCVIRRWQVAMADECRDIVLGFDSFDDYPVHSRSFGIVAGRVANRTRSGRFMLGQQIHQLSINNGDHHLHGGTTGLGRRLWGMENDEATQCVKLTYLSTDGEEGYPGNVHFKINFKLDMHGLHCRMTGRPDQPTPINLAQHNYYNLDGTGDVRRHSLFVDASQYMPVSDDLIPTGEILDVNNTRFDFRKSRTINSIDIQHEGHDHNLVLTANRNIAQPAATLVSSDDQLSLDIITAEPGLQLYSAAGLAVEVPGVNGERYGNFGGLCLEAQHHPDSLNNPEFPSIICTPDEPYEQALSMLILAG